MKVVWWKCGAGHSYRAKIADRTIEQKGCPQCEAEFQRSPLNADNDVWSAEQALRSKSNSDSELECDLLHTSLNYIVRSILPEQP